MNQEIEKKEYIAPSMIVIKLEAEGSLLCESGCVDIFGSDNPENPLDMD